MSIKGKGCRQPDKAAAEDKSIYALHEPSIAPWRVTRQQTLDADSP